MSAQNVLTNVPTDLPVWIIGGLGVCVLAVLVIRAGGAGGLLTVTTIAGVACLLVAFTHPAYSGKGDLEAIGFAGLLPLTYFMFFRPK